MTLDYFPDSATVNKMKIKIARGEKSFKIKTNKQFKNWVAQQNF